MPIICGFLRKIFGREFRDAREFSMIYERLYIRLSASNPLTVDSAIRATREQRIYPHRSRAISSIPNSSSFSFDGFPVTLSQPRAS